MTTQPSPAPLGLPPPLARELFDGDRTIGWITGDRVGFGGFADETEAAHAAWVAYRTLARRLARTHGLRPVPIDTQPLALHRRANQEAILASGRTIATLVRPGADSSTGPEAFGFEVMVPPPHDTVRVRSMAHLMYRTLRKSGLRWALWRPAPVRADRTPAARAGVGHTDELTNNGKGGQSNGTERLGHRARWLPALPWRRAGRVGRERGGRVPGVRER